MALNYFQFFVVCVLASVTGCATPEDKILKSSAYTEKQKIAYVNQSRDDFARGAMCFQPGPDEEGNFTFTPVSQVYSPNAAAIFATYLKNGTTKVRMDDALAAYVKDVSFSERPDSFDIVRCWNGEVHYGALIGELKDIKMTWLRIIGNKNGILGAHKCTFADDPDLWTAEPCPASSDKKVSGSVG